MNRVVPFINNWTKSPGELGQKRKTTRDLREKHEKCSIKNRFCIKSRINRSEGQNVRFWWQKGGLVAKCEILVAKGWVGGKMRDFEKSRFGENLPVYNV